MQIDYQRELNQDQYAAVTSDDHRSLVLAGAGSGKTRTLTYRVAWLLEHNVPAWQILLLTFTNKAAYEMLTRVEDLTGVPRSEFYGGTFHSIGQRILRKNAKFVQRRSDFTIIDADDADLLFSKICKSINTEFFKNKNAPKPNVIYDLISYARNTCTTIDKAIEQRMEWSTGSEKLFQQFFDAYTIAKQEQNLCDYDDLLELFLNLLKNNPDIRERYQKKFKYILVDEFQDTNTLQAEIIAQLTSEGNSLMAVGDDAQCIYTWRGANYENITRFQETYPNAAIHKIEINYRSTPQILNFANSILESRRESLGFSKTLRATREEGRKPFLVPTIDAFDQAHVVIRRIQAMIENEGRSPNDIIILYRAHMFAKELQLELTRSHIPFLITSGLQFFQQAHIRDFTAQLRFLCNPKDSVAFIRVLSLMEKTGPKTSAKILETAQKLADKKHISIFNALLDDSIVSKVPKVAHDDYCDFVITLQNMRETICGDESEAAQPTEQNAELDLFSSVIGTQKETEISNFPENSVTMMPSETVRIGIEGWYGDFIKKIYSNWQERQDDLKSLIEFAGKFETLSDLLAQFALMNTETNKKDVSSSSELGMSAIRLSTIHQAKGLEFPIVFVIGCADEMFPLKRSDEDEERRLFYVACTRAKDELYMLYPKIRSGYGGETSLLIESKFIKEANPDTYETLRTTGVWAQKRSYSTMRQPSTYRDEYSQEIPEDDTDPF